MVFQNINIQILALAPRFNKCHSSLICNAIVIVFVLQEVNFDLEVSRVQDIVKKYP